MVVDHGEEVGLAEFPVDDNERAVHGVGLPEIVDELGLEAAAIFGEAGVLFKAIALEESIEAIFRRPLVRGRKDFVLAGELNENRQADRGPTLAAAHRVASKPRFAAVVALVVDMSSHFFSNISNRFRNHYTAVGKGAEGSFFWPNPYAFHPSSLYSLLFHPWRGCNTRWSRL